MIRSMPSNEKFRKNYDRVFRSVTRKKRKVKK